jgi:hypothetical protein
MHSILCMCECRWVFKYITTPVKESYYKKELWSWKKKKRKKKRGGPDRIPPPPGPLLCYSLL